MSDEPLLQPDEFTQAAAQRLATEAEVEVLGIDELSLHLRVHGREVTSDLESFYALYRNAPETLESVWEMLVDVLADDLPDRSEDSADVLLDRVLPMLKPLALLSEVRAERLPLLVYRPLAGNLMVTYVVDEGQRVVYLNEGHLERWGVGEGVLWARAMGNLRARSTAAAAGADRHGRGLDHDLERRRRLRRGAAAAAGALQRVRGGDPGNLVIGVPSRDFLIAFSDADRRIFSQIQAQIETDARVLAQPLTDQLFTYGNGVLRQYAEA